MIARAWFDEVGVFAAYATANILSGLLAYAWARQAVVRGSVQNPTKGAA